uniref:6-pyruvoyltetrahydropterin synthase n=1 Tax=Aureoumbra lagunensis TaxID=44058 RepID=A0A7S3JNP3_9STRA
MTSATSSIEHPRSAWMFDPEQVQTEVCVRSERFQFKHPRSAWMFDPEQVQTEVCVRSERFKFNAAHFVAFRGFRERLHGHNYTASVRMMGPVSNQDGYVIDFGEIKEVVRGVCKQLNERFLCPENSDVMKINRQGENIRIDCEDGASFSIPVSDCAMLPIVHSTAEELAALLWRRVIDAFGTERLSARGITALEISVAEAPSQEARYCRSINNTSPSSFSQPQPCPALTSS